MCGFRATLKGIAETHEIAEMTWKQWEMGRYHPQMYNIRMLDEAAEEIEWTPARCRGFCKRRRKRA